MAYWPTKSLIILENRLKGQEMETEGYWPITRSSVKQEMEILLINIGSSREQLTKLNRQLQWMEIRLKELINGMESGT